MYDKCPVPFGLVSPDTGASTMNVPLLVNDSALLEAIMGDDTVNDIRSLLEQPSEKCGSNVSTTTVPPAQQHRRR